MNRNILAAYAEDVTRYDDLIERDLAGLPEIVARSQAETDGLPDHALLGYWEDPTTGEIDLITVYNWMYWTDHPGVTWLSE